MGDQTQKHIASDDCNYLDPLENIKEMNKQHIYWKLYFINK
jgi:hypothetical protein